MREIWWCWVRKCHQLDCISFFRVPYQENIKTQEVIVLYSAKGSFTFNVAVSITVRIAGISISSWISLMEYVPLIMIYLLCTATSKDFWNSLPVFNFYFSCLNLLNCKQINTNPCLLIYFSYIIYLIHNSRARVNFQWSVE